MGNRAERLAIEGGEPVRSTVLPYGRQVVTPDDEAAVLAVLRSEWLTTGPVVEQFEESLAERVGALHGVSFSSGTAALHAATAAAGIGAGDEAITSPITFCATANAVLYVSGTPVFADVANDTLCLDPSAAAAAVTDRTRAILPVDFAGHPAQMRAFREIADRYGLTLIEDAAHALGATLDREPVGSLGDMTVFSFHPVKHITTGEGGMVTTDDPDLAHRLRRFRNHGIDRDVRSRQVRGDWYYGMVELAYNYRLTDLGSALGLSQLGRLEHNVARRRAIAERYHEAFSVMAGLRPPVVHPGVEHAWHIYPLRFEPSFFSASRNEIFAALRAENIAVNVHYIPVHLHPYYQKELGFERGMFPIAEREFEKLVTLPLYHGMSDGDAEDVVAAVAKVASRYLRTDQVGGEGAAP